MKRWIIFLLGYLLTACAAATQTPPGVPTPVVKSPELPSLGEAPELTNDIWLNTDSPLRLSDLRGQVVLLDMWTFG